jgi:hypothetical protein
VVADKGSDHWRLSYYDPPFIHNTSHLLGLTTDDDVVIETEFDLTAVSQFDQAGLMVWVSDTVWLKTGIEFADGKRRLSSVVTNDFSQWAVQVRYGHSPLLMPDVCMPNRVILCRVHHPMACGRQAIWTDVKAGIAFRRLLGAPRSSSHHRTILHASCQRGLLLLFYVKGLAVHAGAAAGVQDQAERGGRGPQAGRRVDLLLYWPPNG